MPDGSIVFQTKLDNSEVENGFKQLKKETEKLEKSVSKDKAAKIPLVKQAEDAEKAFKAAREELERLKKESQGAEILSDGGLADKKAEHKRLMSQMRSADRRANSALSSRELAEETANSKKWELEKEKKVLQQLQAEKAKFQQMRDGEVYSSLQEYMDAFAAQEGLDEKIKAQQAKVKELQKEWGKAADNVEKYEKKYHAAMEEASKAAFSAVGLKSTIDANESIRQQETKVAKLQSQWEAAQGRVGIYNARIQEGQAAIDANKVKAAQLTAQMNSGGAKMQAAFNKANTSATKFKKRLVSLASSALIFNVISAGLRGIANRMGKALQTNEEYTAQLAKLKGALLTAFQPIYEYILPGLISVLRVLTSIVRVVASLTSALFGKTAAQSAASAKELNKEVEALEGVGNAAKEAKKSLAGFDEINTLSSLEVDSGGGRANYTAPDFEGLEDTSESLNQLLGIVLAIGAGLITWRIAKGFTSSLSMAAGLALAVGGAMLYAFNWADAFANGISWDNLNLMLGGMLAIIGGLGLAFGAVGAAIGALVTGVGAIIVALNDFRRTGELSDETLMALAAGILAIGGGIALLTGQWIPLVIAAVISLVTFLATEFDWLKVFVVEPMARTLLNLWEAVKDGAWDLFNALKMVFDGIVQLIGGIFKRSIKDAANGIIEILNGIISAFYSMVNSVIRGINAISITIPDWVPEYGGHVWGPNLDLITVPQIPYLAQGAVLPANKPFLAMVGDQKNGTNIEAPLDTIKQAVAEVMAAEGIDVDVSVSFGGEMAPLVRMMMPYIEAEKKRRGNSIAAGNY